MSETIRISEKNKKLIDDIAGQLNTSIKEVVDMIFTWFFTQAGAVDLVEDEALEIVDEVDILDEDEEEE